ncbi:MAG: ketoacyl-ACP synthase III [Candidatus Rokubacteria bacterium]|nr:ketoacyl-ACP synthase III [Candidatus Rokubacteria bacterium]
MSTVIAGIGTYLPERVVTNDDLEAMELDYDRAKTGVSLDEWVRSRHGAVSRHWARPGECTSDMATAAARRALADAGLAAGDVDVIVMATITGDYRLPQAALMVQANLGAKAKVIQLDAACSGFVDSLFVACGLLDAHGYETALVIGADTLTRLCDPRKFMPLTIFGDGAGAVLLHRRNADDGYGVRSFVTGSDGHLGHYVSVPGGGGRAPLCQEVLDRGLHYWRLLFHEIHGWAVDRAAFCAAEAVARAGLSLEDVAWVVPHQASLNILQAVARRLGLGMEKFVVTYPHTGNLSAASIPVALEQGKFRDGDWLVMPSVGAGMAWGAVTYQWYDYKRSGVAEGVAA